MKTIDLNNTLDSISMAVQEAETYISTLRVSSEDRVRAILTLEETLVKIKDLTYMKVIPIRLTIHKGLHNCRFRITYSGGAISLSDLIPSEDEDILREKYGLEAECVIRDMVLRSNANRVRVHSSRSVNKVDIMVCPNEKAQLYDTMLGMFLAIVVGIGLRLLGNQYITDVLCKYLFSQLYEVFLAAISMVVTPLVFFSLAASVAGFGDLSALGRTGTKVFFSYVMTSLFAALACIGLNSVLVPGRPGLMELPMSSSSQGDVIHLSLLDKLTGIVPNNFLGAFVQNDMLQVMFLSILVGVAVGRLGKHTQTMTTFVNALNSLFSQVAAIITRFLPFAIFGSVASMIASTDLSSFGVLLSWVGIAVLGLVLQVLLYVVLISVGARLNPFTFLRKAFPAYFTAVCTSSSNGTMPTTMKCCDSLGISRKVSSFSIPLGANINMDGLCISFTSVTLFMAGLYGLPVDAGMLVTLVASVLLISLALPGVPGAGNACVLMLFAIVGVPAEALGLVIGLFPLLELLETGLNVMGDVAVTTFVAGSEHELDRAQYNKV